jgi:hypothetical protein
MGMFAFLSLVMVGIGWGLLSTRNGWNRRLSGCFGYAVALLIEAACVVAVWMVALATLMWASGTPIEPR